MKQQADLFHALGRFIFKRHFWQYMMIYGISEYCAWLSMLMFYMKGDFFDEII